MTLRFLLLVLCSFSASAQTVQIGVLTLFHPTCLEIRPTPLNSVLLSTERAQFILNGEPGRAMASVRIENTRMFLGSSPIDTIRVSTRDGGPAEFIVSVPDKITRRYQGILRISTNGAELIPVVSMDIETATASIVAAESPPGAPFEALKAQAIAARSFLYAAGGRHPEYGFCDTTHCQFLREPPPVQSPAFEATVATRKTILIWRGRPLAAAYFSRCESESVTPRGVEIAAVGYPYPGMCQYGAAEMAEGGSTYMAILHHFYPESQLTAIPSAQRQPW